MYQGNRKHSVDHKGRLFIPAKFRKITPEEANGTFVVSRGFDRCLSLYSLDVWSRIESKFSTHLFPKKRVRNIERRLIGESEKVTMDEHGRVNIPKHFLEYAQIESDVVVIGLGNRLEIWNPELYKKYTDETEKNLEEDLEDLDI